MHPESQVKPTFTYALDRVLYPPNVTDRLYGDRILLSITRSHYDYQVNWPSSSFVTQSDVEQGHAASGVGRQVQERESDHLVCTEMHVLHHPDRKDRALFLYLELGLRSLET